MNKIFIALLPFLFIGIKGYSQKIKKGKNKHPVLGTVILKKVYEKESDGLYPYLIGKGTYNHEKQGKTTYEITYDGKDKSFVFWEDTYEDAVLGSVTIERGDDYRTKIYIDSKGREVIQRIVFFKKDTVRIRNLVDGKPDGKQYEYLKGVLRYVESYKKGKKIGPFEKYYNNKQLKERGSLDAKQRIDGHYMSFNEKGDTIENRTFLHGKRIGRCIEKRYSDDRFYEFKSKCNYKQDTAYCEERKYYIKDNNNDLLEIVNYKKENELKSDKRFYVYQEYDNIKHGQYKKIFQDFVLEEGKYNNGKKIGLWSLYDFDKKKVKECNYYDSIVECTNFIYSGDRLSKEIQKRNNVFHGYFKAYYENGKLKYEDNYKYGKKNGEQKSYYENGKLEYIKFYKNNENNGLSKWYTKDGLLYKTTLITKGKLKELKLYKKGKLVSHKVYD